MKKRISTRLMVLLSMLVALSIVAGKMLAFNITEIMRFSVENLPIMLAGLCFGPIAGMAVGLVADIVGCIIVGYAINPLVTLGAVVIGLVSGIVPKLSHFKATVPKVVLSVFVSHLLGSVLIKSFGLAAYYDFPIHITMLWRGLNYLIVGAVECVALICVLKSEGINKQIEKIKVEKRKTTMREDRKMTYEEALEYIHGISWTFCKPGLERISELCEKLGNPQNGLKFVHVAGTNGKGSFCSMLESVLRAAGYRTGLYTSPYIKEFNERMRFLGENIDNEELAEITEYVKPIADGMADKPTEFELITAIAFEYFKRKGADVVVLEAGMGGRLDSTNVIRNPLLSVITGIALDHTAFLGDTVEKIAAEKAGIIKDGAPVLFGGCDDSALRVIASAAKDHGSEIRTVDYSSLLVKEYSTEGTTFDYKETKDLKIKLLGSYQPRNASVVLEAIELLRERGLLIGEASVRGGLAEARWPARFEIISKKPLIIFDGAHNPQGIESCVESIKLYFQDKKVMAITGVLRDKDHDYIASKLSEVVDRAFTITPDNTRALSAEDYAFELRQYGVAAEGCESIKVAIERATEEALKMGRVVVCLGSLYTYVDIIKQIK